MSEWTAALADRENINMYNHQLLAARIAEILYLRTGLTLSFLRTRGGIHNMRLDKYRCVQAVSREQKPERGVRTMLARPREFKVAQNSAKFSPRRVRVFLGYDVSDEIDFFMFLVQRKDRLVGLFAFPKAFFHRWGLLRDSQKGCRGTKSVVLYPPGSLPAARKEEFANAQKEFYVDLDGKVAASGDDIETFQRILQISH